MSRAHRSASLLCILGLMCGVTGCGEPSVTPSGPLSTIAERLLESAVRFFEASRNDDGLYRDRLRFDGNNDAPASIAAVGMGLMSLCIGNNVGVLDDGAEKAKTTIRTMLSLTQARNDSGFFYHFIDMETGNRDGTSEFSTIDTAILVSGAMFASSCFPNDAVLDSLAFELWELVSWPQAIADPDSGTIYFAMLDDGTADSARGVTRPFNEYMLVAWLAMLDEEQAGTTGPAHALWQNHYANPAQLRTTAFREHEVLTDRDTPGGNVASSFLSSFVVQFVYYLCHPFTVSADYRRYMNNARLADSASWAQVMSAERHEWGHGAGSAPAPTFYHADAVLDNPYQIVSPHIIAGFRPVDPDTSGVIDLTTHIEIGSRAVRTINTARDTLLWRYSLSDPAWLPEEVQAIDYSSMMLGLTAHVLGTSFFEQHNDFPAWLRVP